MTKYWVGVTSYDHVKIGVEGGFCQLNHGKETHLKLMHQDDWIIYYSPTELFRIKDNFKSFSAIGRIKDSNIYQVKMANGFAPYRRDVVYIQKVLPLPITKVLLNLDFVDDPQKYGYKFRFGTFEITEHDFLLIKKAMTSVL